MQRVYGGGNTSPQAAGDGFLAKFGATGSLVYANYLGGPSAQLATAVAVASQGRAYVNAFANTLAVAGWFALDGAGGVYFGGS